MYTKECIHFQRKCNICKDDSQVAIWCQSNPEFSNLRQVSQTVVWWAKMLGTLPFPRWKKTPDSLPIWAWQNESWVSLAAAAPSITQLSLESKEKPDGVKADACFLDLRRRARYPWNLLNHSHGLGRSLKESMATHSSILAWSPTDRGAWWATVHRVAKIWTWLSIHALR